MFPPAQPAREFDGPGGGRPVTNGMSVSKVTEEVIMNSDDYIPNQYAEKLFYCTSLAKPRQCADYADALGVNRTELEAAHPWITPPRAPVLFIKLYTGDDLTGLARITFTGKVVIEGTGEPRGASEKLKEVIKQRGKHDDK